MIPSPNFVPSGSGDEVGVHVSTAGGLYTAPGRAARIETRVMQVFTRQPNRWTSPTLTATAIAKFHRERARHRVTHAVSHDSYLINLASPQPALWERSLEAFTDELRRASLLGLDAVVSHPGNATDGDRQQGIERNAEAITRALDQNGSVPKLLLELTAGAGTSIGGSLEELAQIIHLIPNRHQDRVGVCFDTCHAWVAGFDVRQDMAGVWARVDDVFGAHRIELIHLNDAKGAMGSHRDRHEHIGRGTIGLDAFRWIMNAPQLNAIPKVLETPKGKDGVSGDLRNLRLLRSLRDS